MKRIISMCLSAVLLLSLCVTGAAKTKTAQAEEMFKAAEENHVYLMEAFAYQHLSLIHI